MAENNSIIGLLRQMVGKATTAAAPTYVTGVNSQASTASTDGFGNSTIRAKDVNSVDALMEMIARVWNGTSFDRQRKPNIVARVASSAAAGSPATVKASAGDLMLFWGQNGAAITYLQIYNKASLPVLASDTPVITYPIPANTVFNQQITNGGLYLNAGIGFAFTTDAAGTTGAAVAAVTAFALACA